MSQEKEIALIGYSGHAFVVADIFDSIGKKVTSYCDFSEKEFNPYALKYLGQEKNDKVVELLRNFNYFIAIGDNFLREKVYHAIKPKIANPVNAFHKSAIISKAASFEHGIMVGPGAIINAQARIGAGVICNSGSIIEHECIIDDFAHIAPGAVLGGKVKVGRNSFIGAGAIVKPGIIVGKNVIVGAGAVIIRNIADNLKVVGNPSRII